MKVNSADIMVLEALVALHLQWSVLLVSSHLFPELLWLCCLSYKVE